MPSISLIMNLVFAVWILSLYGSDIQGEDTILKSQDEFFGFWYGMPMIALINHFLVVRILPVFWKELIESSSAAIV